MLGFSPVGPRRRVIIRARAKVNLGLEVLWRRGDGYHEIRTLLWAIDLADRVTLEWVPDGIALACDGPGVPNGPENLAWRAAALVREATGSAAGVRIRLDKAIPAGAGLGGGSADAAAVLVGLPVLWGVRIAPGRLRALATRLGMDVPFFLGRSPAVASGRGERVRSLAGGTDLALVIVNPGFPLATREVYGGLRPAHFSSGARVRALTRAARAGAAAVAARVYNGLEAVVAERWPGLEEVKTALRGAGALAAVMSGSGSSVVGIAPSRAAGARIRQGLAERPWRTWLTRTVSGPVLGPAAARASWGVAKR